MKLAVVKKLLIEQLPDDVKKWFPIISNPLNTYMDGTVRALTGQLTLADNLKSQRFDITIESTQTYPMKLAYTLNERPTSVTVGQILPSDGSIATYGMRWELSEGQLLISFSGLSAVKHSLTLVAQV